MLGGISIGHFSGTDTGVTVLYCGPGGALGSVDVRGGGPGTRETDLLQPHNTVERVHAVVLSGGSAFGLAAADGVMNELAEQGIGFPVFGEEKPGPRVPIVPGAVIFDLLVGPSRPGPEEGAAALRAALAGNDETMGTVGAGGGARARPPPPPPPERPPPATTPRTRSSATCSWRACFRPAISSS